LTSDGRAREGKHAKGKGAEKRIDCLPLDKAEREVSCLERVQRGRSEMGECDKSSLPATGPRGERGRWRLEKESKGPIECNYLHDSGRAEGREADYEGERNIATKVQSLRLEGERMEGLDLERA